jgi:hypothetical protein
MEKMFELKNEDNERRKWELAVAEIKTKIKTLQADIVYLLFKMAENELSDCGELENEILKNKYVHQRETLLRDEIIKKINQSGLNEKQIAEFVSWHFLIGSTPEYAKHGKLDFENELSIVKFLEMKFSQLKDDFEKSNKES